MVFFGFLLLLVGLVVCWFSGFAQDSFGASYSALSGATVELLIGSLAAVVGAVFLLVGLLGAFRSRGPSYYY